MKRLTAITAALLLSVTGTALGAETTVDPSAGGCTAGGKCRTIGGAVGVSSPGDTIRVLAGSYREDVTVDKDLTIDAAQGAVLSGGMLISAGGVEVLDLIVVEPLDSPAVTVTAQGATLLQRMLIVSGGGGVELLSNAIGERSLTVDSTVVNAKETAFSATTGLVSGNAVLTLNHVTAAKGGAAVRLQTGTAPTSGDIVFASNASILHGASTSTAGGVAGGTVTATYKNSDATAMTGAVTTPETATPDEQLFGEGLFLKAGAPVIDKGGAIGSESDTDVQGDARSVGSATDIGADEYFNHAPTAKLTLSTTEADSIETIVATTVATDIEGAADIASITVDWGDGTISTGPRVEHAYGKSGTFTVSAVVTDKAGASSPASTATVTVKDGSAPQVLVTNPKEGATIALSGGKRKFAVKGVHADASGVAKVEIALTRRSGGCVHYDGTSLKRQGCKQPIFVPAVLKGTRFQLKTPALRFKPGRYQVKVRATDTLGNVTEGFSKTARTLVTFTVS